MCNKLFHSLNSKSWGTPTVIVCDGNSLTQGYLSTNPSVNSYPAVLDADSYFNGIAIYNKGVGAQTTQNMIDDAASDVDSLFSANGILVAWEVGNDIYYNGDVSAAITRFWSYCDARRSVGWKVIILTCPARDQSTYFGDTSGQYNTKLSSANSSLISGYGAHADALIDIASDPRFIGYDLTYYNADKIHYTDAGYAAVAELVKNKFIEVL